MPVPKRLFPSDVELGKRDDDRKPRPNRSLVTMWSPRRIALRRSLKRLILGAALLVGCYYFFMNIPTDLGPRTGRPNYDRASVAGPGGRERKSQFVEHSDPGERIQLGPEDEDGTRSKHWFNGPIKFYELASSLHAIHYTQGSSPENRNVLFAASSTKSAAVLLPLACEMAGLKRNSVHFAFMGRDDLTMEFLKAINGVKDDCDIIFHDARPDLLIQSSDYRMEVSSGAGLGYINTFMHPQAILIDNSGIEDDFFMRAYRDRAPAMGLTLIELPKNTDESLRWITRLDSSSLRFFNKVSIDVVVHAQPAASGSLLRLLRSLSKADYFHSPPPRLTIELPHDVDEPTQRFLKDYKWPPSGRFAEGSANQLNLRHRIRQLGLTPDESSTRFLESFWPIDPATSHLLVLAPNVELSPLFFHYLKYLILEYHYSFLWSNERNLMGISLDLPSTFLNDTTHFAPLQQSTKGSQNPDSATSFLWQAPNSNAALYFGEKWTEIHSFISQSLVSKHQLPTPTTLNIKYVSKTYPSWLEYLLNLSRNRGYHMLYSSLAGQAALATIHNELYQLPEEFSDHREDNIFIPPESGANMTADPVQQLSLRHKEQPLASKSLLNLLPSQGILPSLLDMTIISWDGLLIDRHQSEEVAAGYNRVFRREIGGCASVEVQKPRVEGSADDLFCLDEDAQKH